MCAQAAAAIPPEVVVDRLRDVERELTRRRWIRGGYVRDGRPAPVCVVDAISAVVTGSPGPWRQTESQSRLYQTLCNRVRNAALETLPEEPGNTSLVEINDFIWTTKADALAAVRRAITTAKAEVGS